MKDGNIDQYIAMFHDLAHCAGLNLNEPTNCYSVSKRALESQRTKGTAEEEIRLY